MSKGIAEDFTSKLVHLFNERNNSSKNINEYDELVLAVLVFKELIAHDFEKSLVELNFTDPKPVLEKLQNRAKQLAEEIIQIENDMDKSVN